jgi:voltage-gated potassium channel
MEKSASPWADLRWPALAVVLVAVFGVCGYVFVEGWPFVDALYMTLLTLTAVGFDEARPLDASGKWFTIGLLVMGVTVALVALSIAARAVGEGALGERSRRRRMRRLVDSMTDHFIICAYGRVGRTVAREFEAEGVDFVVIEPKEELEQQLVNDGVAYLLADSTSEAALAAAGIDRARGLVCAVDSDAENVYVALAARALNPDIFVIGRASDPAAAERLYRAGADRVISPYVSSGRHMAAMALRPRVVDYLEVSPREAPALRIEELRVEPGSDLVGKSLAQAIGSIPAVALRRGNGAIIANPSGDVELAEGDLLVLLGEREQLRPLEGS